MIDETVKQFHQRRIRPEDLELIDALPGVWSIARDQELRVFWVSTLQKQMTRMTPEQYIGSAPEVQMPAPGADERRRVLTQVLETGDPQHIAMFAAGRRVEATILPLDEEAFGHAGVVALMRHASIASSHFSTLQTPRIFTNSDLAALSRRELEVLHLVARGMPNAEIAKRIHRAEKTIHHHIGALHKAFGTTSRGELIKEAVSRGIAAFTEEEWAGIVEGEMAMRRAYKAEGGDGP